MELKQDYFCEVFLLELDFSDPYRVEFLGLLESLELPVHICINNSCSCDTSTRTSSLFILRCIIIVLIVSYDYDNQKKLSIQLLIMIFGVWWNGAQFFSSSTDYNAGLVGNTLVDCFIFKRSYLMVDYF
ncbi:unnamed protein product [Amoebophrya sp. A25]|nr:unnamed protein product [Amoebophrya sp. A25]|eukprot:GSA25T00020892001.1